MPVLNRRYFTQGFIVAVLYYLAGYLGIKINELGGFQSPLVWVSSGVGLVCLILMGRHLWPWIAVTAFLSHLTLGTFPVWAALLFSLGSALESWVGATLVLKYGSSRPALTCLREVLILAFLVMGLVDLSISTFEVMGLYWLDYISFEQIFFSWRTWWIGHALGVFVVASLVLTLRYDFKTQWQRLKFHRWEALVFVAGLVVSSFFVFSPLALEQKSLILNSYFTFMLIIYAALRFKTLGVAFTTFVVFVNMLWSTLDLLILQVAKIDQLRLDEITLHRQIYVIALGLTGLLISASMREKEDLISERENLLADVSIDLKNRLSIIDGYSYLVRESLSKNTHPQLDKFLLGIEKASVQILNTVEDLLKNDTYK